MVHDDAARDARRPLVAGERESGFTLIELLFTVVLFGILAGIAVPPYTQYRLKQQQMGATRELVALLRRAQVRAVAEETTYRVDFAADGRSATTFRFNGSTYVAGATIRTTTARVTFTGVTFSGGRAFFYARGSASPGAVTIARSGTSKTYRVNVEGLTARVSYQ